MPKSNYNQVISEVKMLSLSDQLKLLEETTMLIRTRRRIATPPRSILELQGKGKSIWTGLDVQKYIDEERSSWNG